MDIIRATSPEQFDQARGLIREYFMSWGMEDVTDPDLLEELATLDRRYPCVLVASVDSTPAGVVAFYRVDDTGTCEMKRMFVRPGARRFGVGRALTGELMRQAASMGFTAMRLDTPTWNDPAIAMYTSLGFEPIPAFYEVPPDAEIKEWTFLGVDLTNVETAGVTQARTPG